ncbi:MAG: RagB/SusD family nutrient uptake outer membrane protein [Bacteroidetes bacterium]|nr:RagB/SusD family nutrient uptake outer membrane protein [Bacteroidota bacterium]
MKHMIYYICLSLSLPLLIAGCSKALDKKPVSGLTEESYYRNTDEVETAVIGTYAALRDVYNLDFILAGLRSDDSYISEAEGDMNQIDGFGERSTNSYVAAYWQTAYFTIKQSNTVLKYLGNVTDAQKKTLFEGEAKFIRAHMYFNLVRLWGDVPLVTTDVAYNDPKLYVRTNKDSVYNQIIADLQAAIQKLPASWDATVVARATSYAAKGMLAKVYMTQKNYNAARVLLQDLVDNPGPLQLLSSYKNVFGLNNEMNAEVMYAVRYKSNSNGLGNIFTYNFDKVSGSPGYRSASDFRGSAVFVTADSVRKSTTFLTGGDYGTSYYDVGKYQDPTALKNDAGADFIVLRYADILLLYAEVVNELDGTAAGPAPAAALTQFNRIRTRAGVPTYVNNASQVATQSAFRTTIKAERRRELGIEDQRWYDLLRWGDAITAMNAHFVARGLTTHVVQDYQALYPIPQREIDISNGVMKQNNGY